MREAQPVMTEKRRVGWIRVSMVEVLIIILVEMIEGNSRIMG